MLAPHIIAEIEQRRRQAGRQAIPLHIEAIEPPMRDVRQEKRKEPRRVIIIDYGTQK